MKREFPDLNKQELINAIWLSVAEIISVIEIIKEQEEDDYLPVLEGLMIAALSLKDEAALQEVINKLPPELKTKGLLFLDQHKAQKKIVDQKPKNASDKAQVPVGVDKSKINEQINAFFKKINIPKPDDTQIKGVQKLIEELQKPNPDKKTVQSFLKQILPNNTGEKYEKDIEATAKNIIELTQEGLNMAQFLSALADLLKFFTFGKVKLMNTSTSFKNTCGPLVKKHATKSRVVQTCLQINNKFN